MCLMIVGICTIELYIPTSHSLKDKRRVVKSLIERVKNKFNVSIAEVDRQDNWQHAVLGMATVSNESVHVRQTLNTITKFIENNEDLSEVVNITTEIL